MFGRRAFANKILKDTNVEVRRQIAKTIPKHVPNSRPNSSLSCFCEVALNEVIEPINFEEFLAENCDLISSDPLRALLVFPADDISVNVCQRIIRTIKPIIPDFDDVSDQEDPHLNQCVTCYTSNWIVVNKKYEPCVSLNDRSVERAAQTKTIVRQEYEVDIELNNSDENNTFSESQDRTPCCSQSTSCNTTRPQSKALNLPTYLRPPLASDEETSEGSMTPPSNRQSVFSECTPTSSTLTSNDTTPRGSVYLNDCSASCASRSSWHYIDSPRNSRTLERANSLQLNGGPRGSRTNSIFHLRNSQSDPLIPGLLDEISTDQLDRINEIRRLDGRHSSLFSLYPLQDDEDLIELRPHIPPPTEPNRHRILVKCLSLKLELEIEPIFASLALYDARERKKLSENFYFDMNSEPLKRLLTTHISYQDVSTLSRSCVFNITNPSSDMFLVIKLEKVLQGDVNECAEPYMKDEKNNEKLKTNAAFCCERLGKYRMPFAWTAVYLLDVFSGIGTNGNSAQNLNNNDSGVGISSTDSYENKGSCHSLDSIKKRCNDSGSLNRKGSLERQKSDKRSSLTAEELSDSINNFHAVTLSINSFFKQDYDKLTDEDLYKFLLDLKRPTSTLKRLKCIPGVLKIDISPFPEEPPKYCLTPELARLHPYPDDKGRPVKEILEFPSREVYSPHYVYRNLLYIYPKNLNFTNRQGSARNIACKVQIMNNEDDYSALPIIFGKSSCPEFSSEIFTTVNYHNKCPNFNDEIKVKLPCKLTEQTHILFTFYHIHTKPKQSEQTTNETLGYTWIPLYRDGRLQSGSFCLPVMMDRPPHSYSFLSPSIQIPNTKWVDNHKGIFTVTVEAVSSIYSQDINLDHFLNLSTAIDEQNIPQRYSSSNIENEFKTSILSISNAQLEPLVKFVPIILNRLIRLLVRPPVINGNQILNISQSVFEAIASIVGKINNSLYTEYNEIRTGILSTFIRYQVIFPHPETIPQVVINESNQTNGFTNYETSSNHQTTTPAYHIRSNSNPDVPVGVSNEPQFPHNRGLDRTCSVRSPQPNAQYFPDGAVYLMTKGMVPNLQKLFHEELVLQWLVSSGSCRDIALSNAGFFFEIMVKSIYEHLAVSGALQTHRKERFQKQFTDDIVSLVNLITSDIINRLNREHKDLKLIHSLNNAIAYLIRDLLSIMDRYYVFNLIKLYVKQMSNNINFTSETSTNYSFLLKLDFLRIICGHEHFITLNLPFGTPIFPSTPSTPLAQSWAHSSIFSPLTLLDRIMSYSELTDDYRRQHFLTGLIFCSLSLALEMNSASIHSKAVNLIRGLMTSHDWDCRYSEPEVKARIASLYLPLISIILDALPQLYDWKSEDIFKNDSKTPSVCNTLKRNAEEKRRPIVLNSSSDIEDITISPLNSPLNQTVAMAIAGSAAFSRSEEESYEPRRWPLREDTTRHLLVCFLWVLKNANQTVLYRYWSEMSLHRIYQLLEVLKICVTCFEYKGEKAIKKASLKTFKKPFDLKSKLEDAIMGYGSARRELILRRRDRNPPQSSQSFSQTDSLRWRKDSTITRYNSNAHQIERSKLDYETESLLEGYLSSELNMVILDAIEKLTNILSQHSECDTDTTIVQSKELLANVLQIILHSLSLNQSTFVLQNMFATQRSLILKFPQIIFEDRFDIEFCADLCLQLLRHCSSSIGLVRAQASASMYILMRQNFNVAQNFAKIKMQVTMSLSHLVGTSKSFNEPYLRRSLKTILVYAVIDADMQETNFPEQVQELVFNLHMILSDTIKMKEYKEDPEMLLDLMYRIAKGYQNSPDLRLTWLQNMSQKHTDHGNHAEAAHCFIHSAALVCEYLHLFENKSYLPVSCVAFQKISSNILEESLVSNEVPIDNKDGLFTGKSFSESGLVTLLEQAAICFNAGSIYEAVNEVYKLLIPIAESHHDFKKLASIHGKLQDAFIKIEQQTGKRTFGTYFRVGFYGSKFGDLDRDEFVYKEPFLTKLPEISHRLENFYSEQFGADFFEVIKDSNPVDVNKLNPEKAYVQITYVEPYFDSWELESRQTYFEKNYNIKRFIYSTPFTMDGRAHGDLHEQYKRKTILTTVNSFPYVKTRILVQDRQQVVLIPIEVAIEDIQKKTIELATATYQEPIDSKILQMVLQGCVGTTVNQGPMEVAVVFLSEATSRTPQQRPPSPLQNKLKSCFKDFCRKCGDALRKNRSLIGADQKEYQKELERNYYKFTEKLAPLISNNGQQALKALRESYWNSNANNALRTKPNTLL